jgi:hypothetical protein
VRDGMFCCAMHWFNDLTSRDRAALSAANLDYKAQKISAFELRQRQQDVLGKRGKVVYEKMSRA